MDPVTPCWLSLTDGWQTRCDIQIWIWRRSTYGWLKDMDGNWFFIEPIMVSLPPSRLHPSPLRPGPAKWFMGLGVLREWKKRREAAEKKQLFLASQKALWLNVLFPLYQTILFNKELTILSNLDERDFHAMNFHDLLWPSMNIHNNMGLREILHIPVPKLLLSPVKVRTSITWKALPYPLQV